MAALLNAMVDSLPPCSNGYAFDGCHGKMTRIILDDFKMLYNVAQTQKLYHRERMEVYPT